MRIDDIALLQRDRCGQLAVMVAVQVETIDRQPEEFTGRAGTISQSRSWTHRTLSILQLRELLCAHITLSRSSH